MYHIPLADSWILWRCNSSHYRNGMLHPINILLWYFYVILMGYIHLSFKESGSVYSVCTYPKNAQEGAANGTARELRWTEIAAMLPAPGENIRPTFSSQVEFLHIC